MTSPPNHRRRLSRPRHRHHHAKTVFLSPPPAGRRRVSARARLRSHQCRAVPCREQRRLAAVRQFHRRLQRPHRRPAPQPRQGPRLAFLWTPCVGKSFHPRLHREWAGRESHPLNSTPRQLAALFWFLLLCLCLATGLFLLLLELFLPL